MHHMVDSWLAQLTRQLSLALPVGHQMAHDGSEPQTSQDPTALHITTTCPESTWNLSSQLLAVSDHSQGQSAPANMRHAISSSTLHRCDMPSAVAHSEPLSTL